MSWEFNSDIPIYLQIMEHFKMEIASGNLSAGEKIRPVRELALEAGVNPNTMQKALSELEREGYLESKRTSGRFVADKGSNAQKLKDSLAKQLCKDFCENMKKIGFTEEQSLMEYEKYIKESK